MATVFVNCLYLWKWKGLTEKIMLEDVQVSTGHRTQTEPVQLPELKPSIPNASLPKHKYSSLNCCKFGVFSLTAHSKISVDVTGTQYLTKLLESFSQGLALSLPWAHSKGHTSSLHPRSWNSELEGSRYKPWPVLPVQAEGWVPGARGFNPYTSSVSPEHFP